MHNNGYENITLYTHKIIINVTYFFQDGSQFVTSIYLRQDSNEKIYTFLGVLTVLETFEIVDSNSFLAKNESLLEVAGAVVVDAT